MFHAIRHLQLAVAVLQPGGLFVGRIDGRLCVTNSLQAGDCLTGSVAPSSCLLGGA